MPLSDFFKKKKKAIPQTQGKEAPREEIKKEIVKEEQKPQAKELLKDSSGIILRSHVSEKADWSKENQEYVFEVFSLATKPMVRDAVSRMYGVNAQKVRIINVKPKKVRVGKFQGFKPGFKKAIVTLLKGQKIDSLSA